MGSMLPYIAYMDPMGYKIMVSFGRKVRFLSLWIPMDPAKYLLRKYDWGMMTRGGLPSQTAMDP